MSAQTQLTQELAGKLATRNPAWRWLTKGFGINIAITAFCLVLIGAMWTAVVVQTQADRAEIIANAITQNSNLALALEEHTIRTIKGVDAAALFIAYEYARLGTKVDIAKYIEDGFIDGKLFIDVGVIDEHGDLVANNQLLKGVNLADREHFKVHVKHDSNTLYVGKPVVRRLTGKWSIQMTRRINKPDGSFGGVVTIAVDPAYFTDFYRQASLGENGIVNLFGLDGISRARRGGANVSSGQDMSTSAIFKERSKNAIGSLLGPGTAEKVPRYISYRTLSDYPLVVAVGTSQDEVLAGFLQERNHEYWAVLLLTVVILSFGFLLIATLARQRRAVGAFVGSEARFRATFNQAAIGIAHTAPDGRFLQVNQKLCDMLGYTRDELLGLTILDVTHVDDRNRARSAIDIQRARLITGELETYAVERRSVRKDGAVIWTNRTISLVRDAAGAPLYFIRVIEDITERKRLQQDLLHQARHDSLTLLPNRELFYDRLAHALEQAQRRKWMTGVMFIDLDGFKSVNDTLGHGIGDQLLQQVSARLAQCVRADDTVARLGGDEFAVILSELAHEQDGGVVAQKTIDALAKPFQIDGNEIFITASIGITTCPTDARNADTLMSNADAAMYDAKKLGKNNYQFYTAAMNERSMQKLLLEKDLRNALARDEFMLHFQPKANLRTGQITGVEALLRWQRPDGRLVAPLEFIPVLEESGLIVPVGEWVLRAACAQLRAWQQEGITPVPIAVNLSARQFHQQDIAAMVMRALLEYDVDAGLLELEITESAAMHDAKVTTVTLHKLKALGVRIAIDDFGTGYSSLSYLKRFPIDSLKLDRSFVTELPGNQEDASIAQAVITMAHALRLKVVAEGVESEAQLEFLAAQTCDEMQGYYFSHPLPAAQCTQIMKEQRKLIWRPAHDRGVEQRTFTIVT